MANLHDVVDVPRPIYDPWGAPPRRPDLNHTIYPMDVTYTGTATATPRFQDYYNWTLREGEMRYERANVQWDPWRQTGTAPQAPIRQPQVAPTTQPPNMVPRDLLGMIQEFSVQMNLMPERLRPRMYFHVTRAELVMLREYVNFTRPDTHWAEWYDTLIVYGVHVIAG